MPTWHSVEIGEAGVAVAERAALGTTARVVVWPPQQLTPALEAVDRELIALDAQASRFREDSEISKLNASNGEMFYLSDGLAEALAMALAAARWTDGLVDPTIGRALVAWGYDRDFAALTNQGPLSTLPIPAPGVGSMDLDGRLLRRSPGVLLDLGATAKGLGSDRAAQSAIRAIGHAGGVLVSLGGDVAIAGQSPAGGWPILVTEDPGSVDRSSAQEVRLLHGALATSSVTCRRWSRAGQEAHHIIDPRTGAPAQGKWRTATVAASSCVSANAASTALIVGGDEAEQWLLTNGLPARLVGYDGSVRLLGSWPAHDAGLISFTGPDVLASRSRSLRNVS